MVNGAHQHQGRCITIRRQIIRDGGIVLYVRNKQYISAACLSSRDRVGIGEYVARSDSYYNTVIFGIFHRGGILILVGFGWGVGSSCCVCSCRLLVLYNNGMPPTPEEGTRHTNDDSIGISS